MKSKTTTITLIALLTISSFGLIFNTFLTPAAASPVDLSTMGPYIIDATPEMLGEKEVAIREYAAEVGAAEATQASPMGDPATVGEGFLITVSDLGLGVDYDETFVVVMDGTWGIILIEKAAYDGYDAVTDEYVFPNPEETWRLEDRISTDQLAYLLDEFDNTIYPIDTGIFGEPLARGDEGQKVWILIHNIRDESYYDYTQTSYVAGYFSASEDSENNKNMMHIDSYDWFNRIGPESARPYLYEGVFAHEFEHLIHFDIDPDEPSWVDEGLADLAGFLCGYGHSESHVAYYMVYHPFTALTFWGSGLEDYGASYLFQLYLYERFGGVAFVSALVQEQLNGIEGIEATFRNMGFRRTKFEDIFDDWTIANYLDEDPKYHGKKNHKHSWRCKDDGKYGYRNLEIGSVDSWGYTIEYVLANFWWGPPDAAPFEIPSSDYGDPQPYTAHYYRFTNEKYGLLELEGASFSGVPAYSGMYEWYSDAEAWAWRSFYQTFDIPAGGATLNFMTYFEIEGDWDYGYVEVYDQDTGEWYTLDADGTVNNVAHGQDNPNTPTGREPTDYEIAGRWHAFTGASGGWISVTMDLTPFAGHAIDLYFTTWQDGAFTLQMMYVDDISIPEIGFIDDVEAGVDGWTSTGWGISDGKNANDWGLTLINTQGVPPERYPLDEDDNVIHGKLKWRRDMWMWDGTDTQIGFMIIGRNKATSNRMNVAIISNHADHILTSDYTFSSYQMHW